MSGDKKQIEQKNEVKPEEITDKTRKSSKPKDVPKKTSPKKTAWWKIVLYVLAMMAWVGASIIVSEYVVGYSMLAIVGRETLSQPLPTAIYAILSYTMELLLIILVPVLILKRKKKQTKETSSITRREELGLRGLPTWTDIGLAPVGFIVYMILAGGLMALFSVFPWFNAEEVQDVGFSVYSAGFDRIVAFITTVVVAPIAEEIIFRGWLYGKMRAKLSESCSNTVSMIISIALVSLLFGIVHMQWNVGVNVFAMSIVLCGLREITGTIYAGMILHALKNGIAFYIVFVLGIQ